MQGDQANYPALSTGFISQAYASGDGVGYTNITLQILSAKLVVPKNESEQEKKNYRGVISDGVSTSLALFAADCFEFFGADSAEKKHCICKFSQVQFKMMANDKKLFILAGLTFLAHPPFKIEVNQSVATNQVSAPEPVQPYNNFAAQQPQSVNIGSNIASFQQNFNNPFSNSFSNSNPAANNPINTGENITNIDSLNPFQNNWRLKAVVSFKSPIKQYKNAKNEGKLFSVHFLDQTGEIKATGFNEQLDKFYPMLELNKTYYLSGFKINTANERFSTTKHQFELMFTQNSMIEECLDAPQIATSMYNFIKIKEIEHCEVNSTVDLIAVLKEVSDVNEFVSSKTQKELQKREVILVDTSMASVRVTFWGQEAIDFNYPVGSVIQGRGFRVGEFQGKTLSTGAITSFVINPEAPQGYEMRDWWHSQGQNSQFQPLSGNGGGSNFSGEPVGEWPLMTLSEIVNRAPPEADMPEKFSCRATITFIRDGATYPACPTDKCNKKLTDSGHEWYCVKCDRSFPEPSYRYIASACLADAHGTIWISLFNDQSEIIFNGPANEYARIQNKEDLEAIHYEASYKTYLFYGIAKIEHYNDTARVKYIIRNLIKEDGLTSAEHEIEDIKLFV